MARTQYGQKSGENGRGQGLGLATEVSPKSDGYLDVADGEAAYCRRQSRSGITATADHRKQHGHCHPQRSSGNLCRFDFPFGGPTA
jgi:hypothetical protein